MAKIIPYHKQRYDPLDYKRVDETALEKNGQLDLFNQANYQTEATTLPMANKVFDIALQLDIHNDPTAARYYLRAIEKNESKAHALCNLGVLSAHKQEMIDAINYFTQALIEDPRHTESHFNLANVYFAAGNHSLAILHYKIVCAIAPDFDDVYFNLGLAYLESEDFKNAQAALITYNKRVPHQNRQRIDLIIQSLSKFDLA